MHRTLCHALLIFSLIKTTIQEYDSSPETIRRYVESTYNNAKITDRKDSARPKISLHYTFTFKTCDSQVLNREAFIEQFLMNPPENMIAKSFRDINYHFDKNKAHEGCCYLGVEMHGVHYINFIASFDGFDAKFFLDSEVAFAYKFVSGYAINCPNNTEIPPCN
ncbi:unnamed protein product [Caenorhabditis angaria]|uniref:Uncharacterized protein n=1 Tax=Caenorhabditis angaria TaxID=860376 RepID=A0A9P1N092_9PELO|nr:unnamed protein product [Caenorhabditis angaria]